MLSNINVEHIAREVIGSLVEKEWSEIDRSMNLNADLGLASLKFAELVVMLESKIGVDPFSQDFLISDMKTVDDIVRAYEKTLEVENKNEI